MIFADEETEHAYDKSNKFMQALVSSFEAMCFEYGEEMIVIELKSDYCVVLGCDLSYDVSYHLHERFNALYRRQDVRYETLSLIDPELGIWNIYADSGKNLINLN